MQIMTGPYSEVSRKFKKRKLTSCSMKTLAYLASPSLSTSSSRLASGDATEVDASCWLESATNAELLSANSQASSSSSASCQQTQQFIH